MIYIPILKTRDEEMRVARDLSQCFSQNIIPLFEIINDNYKKRYEVDPETNKTIYKKKVIEIIGSKKNLLKMIL